MKKKEDKNLMIGRPEDSAHNYAINLIEKLQEPDRKNPIAKNVENEFESNTCSVCFELMIPPYKPMILFPCGHDLCKVCLFVNGEQKRDTYKLKISSCPLCRKKIDNYA